MAERLIVNLNRFNIPYGQVPMAKSEKNIRRRVWHVIYTPIHTLKPGSQKHGNVNRNFKTVRIGRFFRFQFPTLSDAENMRNCVSYQYKVMK